MSQCKYVLKAGALLQAFSDASKTCTNANLTNELAEWHLKNNPSCARYFAVMPGQPDIPDQVHIPRSIKPTIIVPPEKEIPKTVSDFVESTMAPKVVQKKKVAATKRKK